jgi:hypothetical protein
LFAFTASTPQTNNTNRTSSDFFLSSFSQKIIGFQGIPQKSTRSEEKTQPKLAKSTTVEESSRINSVDMDTSTATSIPDDLWARKLM